MDALGNAIAGLPSLAVLWALVVVLWILWLGGTICRDRLNFGQLWARMAGSEAENWIAKWPVDDNRLAIFLAAPQEAQGRVMSCGYLGSAGSKNVSAILMGRLRVAHQGMDTRA